MGNVTTMLRATTPKDTWRTPPYAVRPIMRFLKPRSRILCPFDMPDDAFPVELRKAGHIVTALHIDTGNDFFLSDGGDVAEFDYIISNPPYSVKDRVFERLLLLNRPFAMLMGATAGLFEGKRFDLFEKQPPELLWLKPRVAFIDQSGRAMKSPPFQSCYVCRGVLPRKIIFARMRKEE
jgi:hypothetical protein